MPEAAEEILNDSDIDTDTDTDTDTEINASGEQAAVLPLDPDFLVFALPFALIVDALDIILELTGFVVIPKLVGIGKDVFTFAVIGGWIYWRTKKIVESKKVRQAALMRAAQKKIQSLTRLKKIGNVSDKVFNRYMRRYGERMGKAGRLMAKMARKPASKAFIKGALFLLGEIVWLVGLIPFWTISVVSMLREK